MKVLEIVLAVLVVIVQLSSFGKSDGDCDKFGVLVYEDLACKAVIPEGKKCPTNYECDFVRHKTGCLFKGKNYAPHEKIASNLTYPSCSIGCSCAQPNIITCATLDCPEYIGLRIPQPGCYNSYKLGECCSTDQICNSTAPKKCEVDGKSYGLGQKFYPKDTCLTCVCHENFNGKYDEKTCRRQNCGSQIRFGSEIAQKCAPAYITFHSESDQVYCCPNHFICPETSDSIRLVNQKADPNSKLECSYGEKTLKFGEGLTRKVNNYGERNLQCECIVPPLLTCKELK